MMLPMTSLLISTKAEVRYNEIDRLFENTITEIFDYEQTEGGAKVEAEKEWLYDINLCELGVLYDFAYKDKEGFAIIIDDGDVKVTEIYTEGKNPYSKENVKNVYVMEGMYWYSDRGNYYESETGTEIGKETLEKVSESAYKGVEKLQYDTERVEFIYRTETPYNVLSSIPTCTYGHLGGCVPIMGTNLIVYYDKTYTNLIPNYEPGRSILGRYRFNVENETTAALTDTLQKDMGTDENGTTIIPKAEYTAAQEIRRERKRKYVKQIGAKQFFQGKIFCRKCGWGYKKYIKGDSVYWKCGKKGMTTEKCHAPNLLDREIKVAFVRMFNTLKQNEKTIVGETILQLQALKAKVNGSNGAIGEIDEEMAVLSKQNSSYSDLFLKGVIDDVLYFEKTDRLKSRMSELRERRLKLVNEDEEEKCLERLRGVKRVLDKHEFLVKFDESLFDEIVDKIYIEQDGSLIFALKCELKLKIERKGCNYGK